jgi:glycerol kinase
VAKSGYILSIDQGTTGTTAILVDGSGRMLWSASREIAQIFPRPGWVEHDPVELFESCMEVVDELLEETETSPRQIEAIGITNQRETTVVWERDSGRPVTNAVVWQCRRTAALCDALKARGLEVDFRERTGLPIDAYFSGTKVRWILDNIPEGQRRAEAGELAFGTVDSWLLWNLTNGLTHATDVTNASRTMLFNTGTLRWDSKLLDHLDIPTAMLASVGQSSAVLAYTGGNLFGGQSIPIAGVAGDQHAALFGQACFRPGMVKNTYGTGSFVLMNTGPERVESSRGLITTPAWGIGDTVTYALEGSIFSTGATVQWLRDGLGIIEKASDTEALAASLADNGGVYLVPAFTGLGAPHWDMYARGTIVGITRGTTRAHFARAALEATAYQTRDVIEAMVADAGVDVPVLRVDGGGTANDFLMQFQSDILGIPIERSAVAETTALGAAYLAGLAVGMWESLDEIEELRGDEAADRTFEPHMSEDERDSLYAEWGSALDRASAGAPDS